MNEAAADLEFAPSPVGVCDMKKLGEGRQADVFVFADGVVKLFRSSASIAAARMEATIMHVLQATGIPMPRLLGTVTIESRPGIVMERLNGADQLSLLERKPWTAWNAAQNLARIHVRLHTVIAPEQLPPLKASIRQQLEQSDAVPLECKEPAITALDRLPDGVAICHWDFHPGNVIAVADGPRIIDWTSARRGDPLADVSRTLLILRGGALPPATPIHIRILTALVRSVVAWRYLREYRRLRPFDDTELSAWASVSVAARLAHGIQEERAYLLTQFKRETRAQP